MANSSVAQIVCWHCRRSSGKGFQLRNIKTADNKKSPDYICTDCFSQGYHHPETTDCSRVYFPTKEQIEEIKKQLDATHPKADAAVAPKETPVRICAMCPNPIPKKPHESQARYMNKKFCSQTCAKAYLKENKLGWFSSDVHSVKKVRREGWNDSNYYSEASDN